MWLEWTRKLQAPALSRLIFHLHTFSVLTGQFYHFVCPMMTDGSPPSSLLSSLLSDWRHILPLFGCNGTAVADQTAYCELPRGSCVAIDLWVMLCILEEKTSLYMCAILGATTLHTRKGTETLMDPFDMKKFWLEVAQLTFLPVSANVIHIYFVTAINN